MSRSFGLLSILCVSDAYQSGVGFYFGGGGRLPYWSPDHIIPGTVQDDDAAARQPHSAAAERILVWSCRQ